MADSLWEFSSDVFSLTFQATKLEVFTLNVCEKPLHLAKDSKRIEEIGQFLAGRDYDVVCLQQLWLEDDYKIICRAVKDNLPFTHFFKSGMIGSGICTFSKWPIVNTFFHKWRLNGYPHMLHHGDWYVGKGIGFAKIIVNGHYLHVYNTQLHAQYSVDDSYLVHRMTQGYETANFMKLTSDGAACSLLVGDLNCQPKDIVHRILCEVANLKDAQDRVESPVDNENSTNLDYILYTTHPGYESDVFSHNFAVPSGIPGAEMSFSEHEAVEATIELSHRPVFDSLEEVDVNKFFSLANEMGDLCEHGKDLVRKNSSFFRAVVIFTLIVLGLLAYYQFPMTMLTTFLLIPFIMTGAYALFMATIWHESEMQKISGVQNDLVALRTHLAFTEFYQSQSPFF